MHAIALTIRLGTPIDTALDVESSVNGALVSKSDVRVVRAPVAQDGLTQDVLLLGQVEALRRLFLETHGGPSEEAEADWSEALETGQCYEVKPSVIVPF